MTNEEAIYFLEITKKMSGYQDNCFEEMTMAINHAIEVLKANNWRPIESAPRDGTWFLSFDINSKNSCEKINIFPTFWRKSFPHCGTYTEQWHTWCRSYIQPTHWMPLPTPPKEGE